MKMLKTYSFLVAFFLWSPLFILLYKGMNARAFSLLLENDALLGIFMRSILLAITTCIISTSLATITAFALRTQSSLGQKCVEMGTLLPMVLPEIAFGISFLVWFTKIDLPLGWTSLLLAHIAFTFSYSIIVMKNSVERIEWRIVDAAKDLGASRFAIFRHALFPQLLPGIVASSVMAFSLSLDDFLISFFVKGIDEVTLPIKIYSMMRHKIGPEIYALSVVLFCISVFSVLISQVWYLKTQKSS